MCTYTVCSLGEATDKHLTITTEVEGNGRGLAVGTGICQTEGPGTSIKTKYVDDCKDCAYACAKKYRNPTMCNNLPNGPNGYTQCDGYCSLGCNSYFSTDTSTLALCKSDCVRPQLPPQNNPVGMYDCRKTRSVWAGGVWAWSIASVPAFILTAIHFRL